MKTETELTKEERVRNDSVAFRLFARSTATDSAGMEHQWRELSEEARGEWRRDAAIMIDDLEEVGIAVKVKSESKMMAAYVTRRTFPSRPAYDLGE